MGRVQDVQEEFYRKLTDEGIEVYVKQGMDREVMIRERAKALEKWAVVMNNPTHLEKLEPFQKTPRDKSSAFVKKGIKKSLFGPNADKIAEAPLVYGAIVQAHTLLFEPSKNIANCGLVVVFALDEEHKYDVEWLNGIASKIKELKNSADVPKDMENLIRMLKIESSHFSSKIGVSVAGENAEAYISVHTLNNTKNLPKTFIPNNKILPFLLLKKPKAKPAPGMTVLPAAKLALVNKQFYE